MTYELISVCGRCYYFGNVEALRTYLRLTYPQPHLTDRKGGYVWSAPEIETATEYGRLVYVWPTRAASEDRYEPPVGLVRRRPTAADHTSGAKRCGAERVCADAVRQRPGQGPGL
jgi:hypothetical protein